MNDITLKQHSSYAIGYTEGATNLIHWESKASQLCDPDYYNLGFFHAIDRKAPEFDVNFTGTN